MDSEPVIPEINCDGYYLQCPKCEYFDIEEFESECPKCHQKFNWDWLDRRRNF